MDVLDPQIRQPLTKQSGVFMNNIAVHNDVCNLGLLKISCMDDCHIHPCNIHVFQTQNIKMYMYIQLFIFLPIWNQYPSAELYISIYEIFMVL